MTNAHEPEAANPPMGGLEGDPRATPSVPPPPGDIDGQDAGVDPALAAAIAQVEAIRAGMSAAVVGQDEVIEDVLAAFLAGGHALLEGIPGLGKTLLVLALARTFGGSFARVQFTPDLMPGDVVGNVVFDARGGEFHVRRGPVFANLLLADEINRAPAKTQAALLEVMQERQVTIDGDTLPVPLPFMTLATQNPLEHEGTYPLPEAQLDRFLLKIRVPYPTEQEELDMVRRVTAGRIGNGLDVSAVTEVLDAQEAAALQDAVAQVIVDDRVLAFAVAIVRATRGRAGLSIGAGPRGALALVRAGRAYAVLAGRGFAAPDDIKRAALPALRHRAAIAPELDVEGVDIDQVLASVIASVPAPRT